MRIKKIASLMLAGIMAISMLTACGGNTIDNTQDPTDPIQPGTDGISAAVETRVAAYLDKTNEEIPEYVDFADDNDLDTALQYAVEFAGVSDVLPQYMHNDQLQLVNDDIYWRLAGAVGDDRSATVANIGDIRTLQIAENANSYKIDDEVVVDLYAISSTIGENAVEQHIAEKIAYSVEGYEYSTRNTTGDNSATDGGNYNHEYTVSVSTYTKAIDGVGEGNYLHFDAASKPAVTFVAVQVVRTSTHQ